MNRDPGNGIAVRAMVHINVSEGGMVMVGDNRISAVLVSTDLDKSQDFYEHKVGLTLSPETIKNHLLFDCGNGTTLLIYGRPSGNSADHTQVRFWTSDIDKDVAELVERGIEFEEYDSGAFKTDRPRRHLARHRPLGLVQGPRRQHHRGLPTRVTRTPGRRHCRMTPAPG